MSGVTQVQQYFFFISRITILLPNVYGVFFPYYLIPKGNRKELWQLIRTAQLPLYFMKIRKIRKNIKKYLYFPEAVDK